MEENCYFGDANVPQTHHSTWGSGPKDYFSAIETIAMLIGTRLSENKHIKVTSMKEKFGDVRVYCHFDVENDDDIVDAIACYRSTYAWFVYMMPHYRQSIINCCDWPEFLLRDFSTYEVEIGKSLSWVNNGISPELIKKAYARAIIPQAFM